MKKVHDWRTWLWNENKAMPGCIWILGSLTVVSMGAVGEIVITHFSNDPTLGIIAAEVGLLACACCVWIALRTAWNARSAFALFLWLVLSIVAVGAIAMVICHRAYAVSFYWYIALIVIAFPLAAIVALPAARHWRRTATAQGAGAQEGAPSP
jgi:hypothetical protein